MVLELPSCAPAAALAQGMRPSQGTIQALLQPHSKPHWQLGLHHCQPGGTGCWHQPQTQPAPDP